ncbi:Fe(3+) ABC transporter substrate-binding protein [Synechococcus sp. Nb3U1]|nr:Fe(3+) ABC transporter substrate-binding protein [Synechococcus sp. Nb3U1]MCF2970130.1 Fe(3+) ABC transporter substrate-binding protein [Synechococcus sp. Nb3U1]
MRLSRRQFVSGVSLGSVALAAGSFLRPAHGANQEVNLYTSRHYGTDEELYELFKQKTGITVNWVQGNADEITQRIRSEGANSPADIFMTVDIARLWRAQNEGLFQPIESATLSRNIPASLRDPEGHWFGLTKRARVIMYNKDTVDPGELSTYENLADPKWRGKVLTRSSSNVYSQSLTASIILAHGIPETEEWARGLVANFARPPEGGDTDQIKAVAAGVGDVALSNTYYLPRLIKSDNPEDRAVAEKIGVFFPNQEDRGTHVNISGAGILKTSPNKEAAIQFLEFLSGPEAQAIFAQSNNEYPVLAGAEIDSVVASFGSFKEDTLNAASIGRVTPDALMVMDRAGWK